MANELMHRAALAQEVERIPLPRVTRLGDGDPIEFAQVCPSTMLSAAITSARVRWDVRLLHPLDELLQVAALIEAIAVDRVAVFRDLSVHAPGPDGVGHDAQDFGSLVHGDKGFANAHDEFWPEKVTNGCDANFTNPRRL